VILVSKYTFKFKFYRYITEHTMPVTAVAFLPSGHALLSASLDGTVRAFDLMRYRNFRVLTSPDPCQFVSLAVDPSGEVVCAGETRFFSQT
jgi:periodic tryptophan protein 2